MVLRDYISSHKGSCWCDKEKTKRQESSGTRLDKLAKGAFAKGWKHGMGCVMALKASMVVLQWYFY